LQETLTHEIGHDLGLQHPFKISCPQDVGDSFAACERLEYGNSFSNMGAGQGLFSPDEMQTLGLFGPDATVEGAEGRYEISSRSAGTGLQHLIIPVGTLPSFDLHPSGREREGNISLHFSVHFRSPGEYDNDQLYTSRSAYGVFISLASKSDLSFWSEDPLAGFFDLILPQHLVDRRYRRENYGLLVGDGRHFNQFGLGINVHAISAETASVEVYREKENCWRAAPGMEIVESVDSGSNAVGRLQEYRVKVTNNDSQACGLGAFDLHVWPRDFSPGEESFFDNWEYITPSEGIALNPGQSRELSVFIRSPEELSRPRDSFKFNIVARNSERYYYKGTDDQFAEYAYE
ncbi:MAG: hypothetical protein KDD42_09370, partial [Bdellovibrionales bacterium]|nr:hypothetical protein [Bdellovibrionales bacterium]